jgi:hypothetical protein
MSVVKGAAAIAITSVLGAAAALVYYKVAIPRR